MERVEKTIFLSYRRTNAFGALAIFQNLTQHGFDVFFDFNGLASGDFERVIVENIKARAHFLVLLTPSALERCHDPGDWLRREIETALANRRNIVPLLLEGFDFRAPDISRQLTGSLAPLKALQLTAHPARLLRRSHGPIEGEVFECPRLFGTPPSFTLCGAGRPDRKVCRCRGAGRQRKRAYLPTMVRASVRGPATPTRKYVYTTRRSGSSRTMPTPSSTGAMRGTTKATLREQTRISSKRST